MFNKKESRAFESSKPKVGHLGVPLFYLTYSGLKSNGQFLCHFKEISNCEPLVSNLKKTKPPNGFNFSEYFMKFYTITMSISKLAVTTLSRCPDKENVSPLVSLAEFVT